MAGESRSFDIGRLTSIGAVVAAVIIALGLYNRVTAMEQRVADIAAAVDRLEGLEQQITDVEVRVASVRADMMELVRARDDLLTAICDVLGRRPDQCGVVPDVPETPPSTPGLPPPGYPGP